MTDNKEYIKELLSKVLSYTATSDEIDELSELIQSDTSGDVVNYIDSILQNEKHEVNSLVSENKMNMLVDKILQSDKQISKKTSFISYLNTKYIAVAAAVILLIISTTFYLWKSNDNHSQKNNQASKVKQKDILPGSNKATLTLANGTVIMLDSAANGVLAQQGNTQILKTRDGNIIYSTNENASTTVLYNTVSTPRGGQYKIALPDGSMVWLNAATTLRFPAHFNGNERVVELNGEAYFEVQKNAAQPFKVKINDVTVKVLGTHFNIMAYSDEDAIKTTLLEGSVKINNNKDSALLAPNQQAIINNNNLQVIQDENVNEDIAWKNGYFQFKKIDEYSLRQISRWYNIDIVYECKLKEKQYTGRIERNVNLSNVIDALNLIGVNSKIENNKLVVLP